MLKISRTVRVLRCVCISGLIAAGASVGLIAPAQAATRDGACEPGEFCYYYNSNNAGSVSDHVGSRADYGSGSSCYEFKSSGAGRGKCIKNDAASVWNRTGGTVRVYYNSHYGGAHQDFAAGAKGNLNATLQNNNASHKLLISGSSVYPAKNDYPYRGQSEHEADTWNFFKVNCTSFVAWAINGRVGVPLHNHYKGVHWGNAKNWDNAARSAGIPIYSRPRAGDGEGFDHVLSPRR